MVRIWPFSLLQPGFSQLLLGELRFHLKWRRAAAERRGRGREREREREKGRNGGEDWTYHRILSEGLT